MSWSMHMSHFTATFWWFSVGGAGLNRSGKMRYSRFG